MFGAVKQLAQSGNIGLGRLTGAPFGLQDLLGDQLRPSGHVPFRLIRLTRFRLLVNVEQAGSFTGNQTQEQPPKCLAGRLGNDPQSLRPRSSRRHRGIPDGANLCCAQDF
jgi:hypothetical protein